MQSIGSQAIASAGLVDGWRMASSMCLDGTKDMGIPNLETEFARDTLSKLWPRSQSSEAVYHQIVLISSFFEKEAQLIYYVYSIWYLASSAQPGIENSEVIMAN